MYVLTWGLSKKVQFYKAFASCILMVIAWDMELLRILHTGLMHSVNKRLSCIYLEGVYLLSQINNFNEKGLFILSWYTKIQYV